MKVLNLENSSSFNVRIIGRAKVDVFLVENSPYIEVINDNQDNFEVSTSNNNILLVNKISKNISNLLPRVNQHKDKKDKNPLSILLDFASDIVDLVNSKKNKDNLDEILYVKLYLNNNVDLVFNGDGIDLSLSRTELSSLRINCANVHFSGDEYTNKDFFIESSNLSADILLDNYNHTVELKGNNSKINAHIGQEYEGILRLSGNNIKLDDPNSLALKLTNTEKGSLSINMNNAKISLFKKR